MVENFAQNGHTKALNLFYKRYLSPLQRFCMPILTDGRVKYSSTWYAFYVNMAKNEIHVVVSPNKSKNQRSVRFLGDDLYGAGLVSFEVDQEADSTAAN